MQMINGHHFLIYLFVFMLYRGMSYSGYGHVVDSCPHNGSDFTAAATRLKCGVDKFNNTWYTCVPRRDLAALVEFCYNATGKVSLFPKDHCLWIEPSGVLQSYSCRQFTEGCPTDSYLRSDLYQYPACSQINTEHRCFYADPSCPNETVSYSTEDGPADVGIIIGSVLAVLVVLLIVLAVVFCIGKRIYSRVPEEDPELAELRNDYAGEYSTWKTSISVNIPPDIVRVSYDERRSFLEELNQTGERVEYRGGSQGSVQHVNWLRRNGRPDIMRSCIGLHPHNDIYIINNTAYRKHSQHHDRPPAERCLLYCLLMADDYTVKVKDESHIKVYNAIRERYFTDQPVCEKITAPQNLEGIIHVENDVIKFKSDNIRHDVMYAFVTDCLVKDTDLKFFLEMASRDVISEYCRSWDYERSERERCLYIPDSPDEMCDLFIDRLQLDILTHCTMSDRGIHHSISKRLHIPMEVLSWSDDAKRRFLTNFQKGSIEMFRARGMIVGCAGAGKTTILRRLQRHQTENLKTETETTIALEVHNDMFEIISDNLEDFKSGNDDNTTSLHENKKLISMTDFAGQVVYYACHQIYLSRRAFYLLVIDMSKNLKDKAYNPERHDPIGSLFENWTYEQYFVFWLQSIKTYCDDKKKKEKYGEDAGANPVILIATHRDQLETGNVKKRGDISNRRVMGDSFYSELVKCLQLPKDQILKSHISRKKYFEVECPQGDLSKEQEEIIDKVRKCIVETATSLPHWGDKFPIQWSYFEEIVHECKDKKIIQKADLQKMNTMQSLHEDDMDDMLRFYHEIGQIIYFSDKDLRDVIILDVQWFVDAFKTIITDPTHVHDLCVPQKDWDAFMNTGMLSETILEEIWKAKHRSYNKHKKNIMPYMEKLGLLAYVKLQKEKKHKASEEIAYYIPSINKKDLENEDKEIIDNGNKTPVLLFHFKSFLSHFFFFRLVVNCLQEWKPLRDGLFFKNAAFYQEKGGNHCIALAVSKSSIQLQVFTPDEHIKLDEETTKRIRSVVEDKIKEITTTFHEQVKYEKVFHCKDLSITEEDEDLFLQEHEVDDLKTRCRTCPIHLKKDVRHQIDRDHILKYWHKTPNPNVPNTAQQCST